MIGKEIAPVKKESDTVDVTFTSKTCHDPEIDKLVSYALIEGMLLEAAWREKEKRRGN